LGAAAATGEEDVTEAFNPLLAQLPSSMAQEVLDFLKQQQAARAAAAGDDEASGDDNGNEAMEDAAGQAEVQAEEAKAKDQASSSSSPPAKRAAVGKTTPKRARAPAAAKKEVETSKSKAADGAQEAEDTSGKSAGGGASKKAVAPVTETPPKTAADKKKGAQTEMNAKPAAQPGADETDKEKPGRMDMNRFFGFAQCSLKMEAQHFMNHNVTLKDPVALDLWPDFEKMATRNLGKNEKWVPMHTVLGVHEMYVVKSIHHADVKCWDAFRRFVVMFIFRAHCKRELFELQLPFLQKEEFWTKPEAAFDRESPMEIAIRDFRAQGNALQTACFLIIPERLEADDNENIIINLLLRTQRLIGLARDLWPLVNDKKKSAQEKFNTIKEKILQVRGLGETWVKMLTVVIDIAKPEMKLLQDRCEVGVGASDPLRKILEGEGLLIPREKKEVTGPRRLHTDAFEVIQHLKSGIISIKKKGKQLLQVTKGMAGSLDRAHAIAEILCQAANEGKTIEELAPMKEKLFADKSIEVKELGLDKQMEELLAADAAKGPKVDHSKDPTPMMALVQLRDQLVAASMPSSKYYHIVLKEVEDKGKKHFKSLPLVAQQMRTATLGLSCATLQVQLCEFRQFENSITRAPQKRPASEVAEE